METILVQLRLLKMAVREDDPKREILMRVDDLIEWADKLYQSSFAATHDNEKSS